MHGTGWPNHPATPAPKGQCSDREKSPVICATTTHAPSSPSCALPLLRHIQFESTQKQSQEHRSATSRRPPASRELPRALELARRAHVRHCHLLTSILEWSNKHSITHGHVHVFQFQHRTHETGTCVSATTLLRRHLFDLNTSAVHKSVKSRAVV